MLHQDSSRIEPELNQLNQSEPIPVTALSVDIQRELNRLEEIILDSPRLFLTKRTLIDEEQLLDQLDLVRINLPDAFEAAKEILRQKEVILLDAEEYAQEILGEAQRRSQEILEETGIIRQAEFEANQIREGVRQECEQMQQQTLSEIEQMRIQAHQEIEQLRQMALDECEDIQNGADEYADAVLSKIEEQLGGMLRVIRNGRSKLGNGSPPDNQGIDN